MQNLLMKLVFNALGIFLFSFLFWKKLKDDYLANQIFSSAILIIAGTVLLNVITKLYFPTFWFWGSLLGFLLGLLAALLKFGLRPYETFEAALISILPWLSFLYLEDSIVSTSWFSLIGFVITLATFFGYVFLSIHYKNFSWYKSGRVGFAGLTSAGLYFLVRGIVAIFFPFVLSFVGDYEPILSGVAAFAFFSLVFNLSRV